MDFNIKPLGVSVEQFRNNPKLQIEAAANLANQFKSQFTEEDRKLAKEKGYNENALLAGAWLGGVKGVRKVLKGEGNPSDKHWSKEGKGTTVKDRMDKFNKMEKGGVLKYEDGKPVKYGTKEYATAYNNGNLTRYDEATDTYVAPELEEAKVVAENYNPVGVAVSRKLNSVGNSITQNAIEFSPLAPVLGATKVATSYMPGSTNYGEHTDAWKSLGIDLGTLGAFAIAKPVLQVTSKTLKQPIKKYGTKLANKLENRFPNTVDKFHTWNAKDNMNNMLMHEVIKNKKSRLIAHEPNYVEDWNRIKSDPLNTPNEAEHLIKRDFPTQNERVRKINEVRNVEPLEAMETLKNKPGIKEIYNNPNLTNEQKYNSIADNLLESYTTGDKKAIHVGSLDVNPKTFKGTSSLSFSKGSAYSHELDHVSGWPTSQEFKDMKELLGLTKEGYIVNTNYQGTEMKARLGQLKDLFGLKGNKPISSSQLRTAVKLYRNPTEYGLPNNFNDEGFNFQLQNLFRSNENTNKILNLQQFMNKVSLKKGGKVWKMN